MVRMIFSDFDLTLLDYHSDKNYFDDDQIEVLKKLKDNNILFSIVTGRSVNFFDKFTNILPYIDFIISSNGSYIYDVNNRMCIYNKYIKFDCISKIREYAFDNNYLLFYNSNGVQYKDDIDVDFYNCEQVIMSFDGNNYYKVLNDILNMNAIICNNKCEHSDRYTVDINDDSVSKGNGIKYLCNYLDIDVKDTIGFGDSENDLSMFDVVGKSIAVSNATSLVKKHAVDIILSVDDNGVFKYIENNFLGGK